MNERVVTRHLTKKGAHEACSKFRAKPNPKDGRSSGWSRMHYDVKPWARFFYKVVQT
jgi:hypothetical protein